MKKQRFFMLGIITVLVAVLSLTFVSSTFAKYTSTVSGSDSARVAKWAWEFNGADLENTFEFDLFKSVIDTKDGAPETDISNVYGSATDQIIAPGTQGSFEISFVNKSEVTAEYTVDYAVVKSDNTLPIKFSVDGGHTWTDDLADVAVTQLAVGSAKQTINVQWKWAFDGDIDVDTALGKWTSTAPTVTVAVTINFSQVD